METIEDLIVLNRAVPELRPRGGGSKGVCLAGYSPSRGFIRIDPCRVDLKVSRWDILRIEVERRPQDSREESWRIVDARQDWENANKKVQIVGRIEDYGMKLNLLENNLSKCVNEANDAHISMCIIKPSQIRKLYWAKNPQYGKPYQTTLIPHLNEEWVNTKADYKFEPRIAYTCPDCRTVAGHHDMKFIGWDAFEFARKTPDNLDQYWVNAKFPDPNYQHYFVIGNQANQRTSYLVIGVIWLKKPEQQIIPKVKTVKDNIQNEQGIEPPKQIPLF